MILALTGVLASAVDAPGAPPAAKRAPATAKRAPARPMGPPPIRWEVKPDPPAQPLPTPANPDVEIPVPPSFFGGEVTYPTTPSAFVALGRNSEPNDVREIWDISANDAIGTIQGVKLEKPYSLSADGTQFAGKVPFAQTAEIFSTKTGESVAKLALPSPFTDIAEFAGPNRFLVGKGSDRAFHVFDVRESKPLYRIVVFGPVSKGIAFSPGGAYVAFATDEGARLQLFELASGKLVGDARLPKNGVFDLKCLGLAFSSDGSELSGLFDSFGLHLLNWSVQSGRMIARLDYDEKSGVKAVPFYEGRAIEWLADKSGWLLFGSAVIDPVSGRKVFTIPSEGADADKSGRRVFGKDRVLVASGDAQHRVIRSVKISTEQIRTAAKIISAGGSAADAALPALHAADLSGAKTIRGGEAAAAWAVTPDPAPTSPVLRQTYELPCQTNEVQAIDFAGTDSLFVASLAGGFNTFDLTQNEGKPRRLDRISLSTGAVQGRVDLPGVSDVASVSPDGRRALMVEVKDRRRVDVFSVGDKAHVVGWRPYEKGADRSVAWASFLDADRVLTVSAKGTIALWSLPACKAVYVIEGASDPTPILSPGRKMLATFLGGTFRFYDAATGALRGQADTPSPPPGGRAELKGAAFLPDGSGLAAFLNNAMVVCWDIKTGRVRSTISAALTPNAMQRNQVIEWCGPKHVLLDGQMLLDVERRVHVWSYYGSKHSLQGPDGRHWYQSNPFPNKAAVFASASLPEAAVGKTVAMADNPQVNAVLRVGGRVAVQLELTGPPRNPDAFRSSVLETITNKLRVYGMTVDNGAPLRLVLHVEDKDTGRTVQLRQMFQRFGQNPFATQSLPIHNLICEIWLADAQGRIDLAPKRSIPTVGFEPIIHMPAGENDPGAFLTDRQWQFIKTWLGGVGFPYFVARQAGKVVKLPGSTNLAAD